MRQPPNNLKLLIETNEWEGSESQKKAMQEVWEISTHRLMEHSTDAGEKHTAQLAPLLEQAEGWLLRAETSCYFFWGDAWLPKVYDNTTQARHFLRKTEQLLQ